MQQSIVARAARLIPPLAVVMAVAALVPEPAAASRTKTDTHAETTLEGVEREMAELKEALAGYSAEQRDEAMERIDRMLETLDARIERLEGRMADRWSEMDEAARARTREALRLLRKRRSQVAEWYGGLKHSSAAAWEEVKAGFLRSYEVLQEAFGQAQEAF